MAPTYRIERDRGSKEFPQQLAVLRERWPIAFPTKHEDVRPLAMGVAREVAAAMSWSRPSRPFPPSRAVDATLCLRFHQLPSPSSFR